jgi:hypothetical protein
MKTIRIKNQKEWDALPEKFEEFTKINIYCGEKTVVIKGHGENSSVVARENSSVDAWGNSSVVARENSSVVARENSRVDAWENSSVVAWENSSVDAWGNSSVVARENSRVDAWGNSSVVAAETANVCNYSCRTNISLYDNARAVLHQDPDIIAIFDKAYVTKREDIITPTFGDWLERGWVVADGIRQRLISQKSQGEVTIYKTEEFLTKETFYVAQKGDKFAHAKTTAEAIKDLRYKISDRDLSDFNSWKLTDKKSTDELIEAYRVITGACSEGTKMWCEGRNLKDRYTLKEVIELTKGSYASEQFARFFEEKQ